MIESITGIGRINVGNLRRMEKYFNRELHFDETGVFRDRYK